MSDEAWTVDRILANPDDLAALVTERSGVPSWVAAIHLTEIDPSTAAAVEGDGRERVLVTMTCEVDGGLYEKDWEIPRNGFPVESWVDAVVEMVRHTEAVAHDVGFFHIRGPIR